MDNNTVPAQPVVSNTNVNQPPPQKPSKCCSKPFLVIIMLLLAIGLVTCGYLLGTKKLQTSPTPSPSPVAQLIPTPDPIADWKTYLNNQYNFSLKYPSNWVFKEGAEGPEFAPTENLFSIPGSEIFSPISVFIKTTDTFDLSRASLNQFEEKPIIISGINTNRITGLHQIDNERITGVKFIQNGKIFIIVTFGEKYIQTFDQILSTFKFLDETGDTSSEIKQFVINYLQTKGHDVNKIIITEIKKLGNLTDVYSVSWTEEGNIGGGRNLLIGKIDNQWIIPDSGDSTYCNWIITAGLDKATQAFLGPTCK